MKEREKKSYFSWHLPTLCTNTLTHTIRNNSIKAFFCCFLMPFYYFIYFFWFYFWYCCYCSYSNPYIAVWFSFQRSMRKSVCWRERNSQVFQKWKSKTCSVSSKKCFHCIKFIVRKMLFCKLYIYEQKPRKKAKNRIIEIVFRRQFTVTWMKDSLFPNHTSTHTHAHMHYLWQMCFLDA